MTVEYNVVMNELDFKLIPGRDGLVYKTIRGYPTRTMTVEACVADLDLYIRSAEDFIARVRKVRAEIMRHKSV